MFIYVHRITNVSSICTVTYQLYIMHIHYFSQNIHKLNVTNFFIEYMYLNYYVLENIIFYIVLYNIEMLFMLIIHF